MDAVNVLPLLNAALADLAPAQLINDARTDTYLYAQQQQPPVPPPQDSAPTWTLARCTFHAGHPLASTLWTCSLLRLPSHPRYGFPAAAQHPLELTVSRALVLGTLKCSEIVWEELAKGQVYEHEDVHLSLSTLHFPSLLVAAASAGKSPSTSSPSSSSSGPTPQPPVASSPLAVPGQDGLVATPTAAAPETVSTDEVLSALDKALQALHVAEVDAGSTEKESIAALKAMLLFRISFLYVLALLTAPTRTTPRDVLSHLSDLSTHLARLSSSLTTATPPPGEEENTRLRAEVHARYFTPQEDLPLLATQQPPRPVRALSLPASLNQTADFVRDLEALARVWRWWDEEEGKEGKGGEGDGGEAWRRVERWARRCAGRRGSESVPYVRSLQQSLIVPSPSAPLFGTHPLLALVASYLDASLPAPPAQPSPRRVLRALSRLRLRSSAPSQLSLSPAHHVLLFLENPLGREFLLRLTVHAKEGVGVGEEEEGWSRKVQEGFKPAWEGVLPKLVQECAADEVDDGAPSPSPSPSLRAALERFPTLLARALERQRARFALEAHLSGFEDELVGVFEACGEEEKCAGWWVGERLARALLKSQGAERAKGDIGGGGKAEEEEEEEETRAIATLCRTSRLLSRHRDQNPTADPHRSPRPNPTWSTPFLPGVGPSAHEAARGRFRQHHGWLSGIVASLLPVTVDGAREGGDEDGEGAVTFERYERDCAEEQAHPPWEAVRDELVAVSSAAAPGSSSLNDDADDVFDGRDDGLEQLARAHLARVETILTATATAPAADLPAARDEQEGGKEARRPKAGPQAWFALRT
ncbi:N-alpha-acetyltransferase, non-catalitic subunit [Rhodotorula sphaerocarpa]